MGHNLSFDLAYSLYSFGDGWLPATWRDYRQLARAWLPGARAGAPCLPWASGNKASSIQVALHADARTYVYATDIHM